MRKSEAIDKCSLRARSVSKIGQRLVIFLVVICKWQRVEAIMPTPEKSTNGAQFLSTQMRLTSQLMQLKKFLKPYNLIGQDNRTVRQFN